MVPYVNQTVRLRASLQRAECGEADDAMSIPKIGHTGVTLLALLTFLPVSGILGKCH
jgi:hypothetical protein